MENSPDKGVHQSRHPFHLITVTDPVSEINQIMDSVQNNSNAYSNTQISEPLRLFMGQLVS
jgi:hypothetical protein